MKMASHRAGAQLWQLIARNPCLSRRHSTKPQNLDIESILSKPSWSVRSLLPNKAAERPTTSVTPEKLRHLLRLSALPQPSNPEEEQSMLRTLGSQIHFVQEMQRVDTTGVEPLRSIRDESPAAREEVTIGLERLKDALAKERVSGRRRRVQRVPSVRNGRPEEAIWNGNALKFASKKKGPYFVVETGSGQPS